MSDRTDSLMPLVAVGGVGGSGTRLVAELLRDLGVFIGADLNKSSDNLTFTLLFKRKNIDVDSDATFDELLQLFCQTMTGSARLSLKQRTRLYQLCLRDRGTLSREWLFKRARAADRAPRPLSSGTQWGWKEPNTHIVLGRILERLPQIKYINVVRNGLDMAHSQNANQIFWWSKHVLGNQVEATPRNKLSYWCAVQKKSAEFSQRMGPNYMHLDYDAFCQDPATGISHLADFLGVAVDATLLELMLTRVRVPDSIGRFRQFGTDQFAPNDVAYVRELGFDVA